MQYLPYTFIIVSRIISNKQLAVAVLITRLFRSRLTKFHNDSLSDEVIMKLNDQLNMIRDNIGTEQEISITYFVPDDKKSGGAYLTHSGIVKKIDEFERKLIMQDETVIPTEQISVIQGEMFKGLYE